MIDHSEKSLPETKGHDGESQPQLTGVFAHNAKLTLEHLKKKKPDFANKVYQVVPKTGKAELKSDINDRHIPEGHDRNN